MVKVLPYGCMLAAALAMAGNPALARIMKTKPSASANWNLGLPLLIGSAVEFETDSEQSQYDFPILMEYNFSEDLKIALEQNIVHISSKSPDVRSLTAYDEIETSIEYEFLHERRYRPAVSLQGAIKWPTASDPDVGSHKTDYSVGLAASKDMIFADFDFNAFYTFVGKTPDTPENTLELSLATEVPLIPGLNLEMEVSTVFGKGGFRGRPGTIGGIGGGGSGNQSEVLVGFAEQVNDHLKLEQGVIIRDDQTWQALISWEWSFPGEN